MARGMLFDLARPALFAIDPERAHRLTVRALALAGRRGPPAAGALAIDVAGLGFPNPLGMAAGFDKDAELATMTGELHGVANALGLMVDDAAETLAGALVPASSWGKVAPSKPGTLELKRMYSGGAPCYYADGMISAAIGGVIGAEAVVHGQDPDPAIRRALRPWRRHNFLWWLETNKISALTDRLLRVNVQASMAYPHSAGLRMWKSAA